MKRLLTILLFVSQAYASHRLYLSHNVAEQIISDVYKNINGFLISEDERNSLAGKGASPVYGEITCKGAAQLLEDLKLTHEDIFYDLGSGVGKFAVQVYLTTPVKASIGIELSPTRFNQAQQARNDLKRMKLIHHDRKLKFFEGNIETISYKDATLIFLASTCFTDELMNKMIEKLKNGKKNIRILTLKKFPQQDAFNLTKEYHIEMSWAESTPVYLYQFNVRNTLHI